MVKLERCMALCAELRIYFDTLSGGNQPVLSFDSDLHHLLCEIENMPPDETTGLQTANDTILVLSRYILKHCNYDRLRDHACAQCMPEGGDLVKIGFVCAYHLAQEYARSAVTSSGGT